VKHFFLVAAALISTGAFAETADTPPTTIHVNGSTVRIPRIDREPRLEDFEGMRPNAEWAGKLALVDKFTQRDPKDGQPAMNKTEVYLGYDDKNFYTIWVCWDDQPKTVRARLARRESIGPEDDEIQLYLDTFNDQRRSYGFMTNPRGIQYDYIWTEERTYDTSWDTLWYSDGKVTDRGWIAKITVPFKSMRFPKRAQQTWGILLQRVVPRTNENLFWPPVTRKISGRLNQQGRATGLENVSPGRNLQLIPYGILRSFRAPDLRDPSAPQFGGAHLRGDVGLDAKAVIRDSFVLDVAINPDFSQVESDEPQVTSNQRFEVFFPEKRPFFLENSDFFKTPIDLLFTRRIADPSLGLRLTGKTGPYKVGLLFADDEAPGKTVPDGDPLEGKRALFGVGRVSRDLWTGSSIAAMYTQRQFEDGYNRVASIDTRMKFGQNYTLEAQSVGSLTKPFGTTDEFSGSTHQVWFDHSGRHVIANTMYQDTTEDFLTETGFFRRPDIRRFSNYAEYRWRPEGETLQYHGPSAFHVSIWDHSGTRLEHFINMNYRVGLPRTTEIGVYGNGGTEILRPKDYATLPTNTTFDRWQAGVFFSSFFIPQLSFFGEFNMGRDINFFPGTGLAPSQVKANFGILQTTVKPFAQLTIINTYLLNRLRTEDGRRAIFNDHTLRSQWNYQFTRELSLRFIAQYNGTLVNPVLTSQPGRKNLNADVLVTWLLNPGTAVYVGYNTNMTNPDPTFLGPGTVPNRYINDARGFFVKASYLFRF
jgi:hypothetical protein